MSFSCMTLALSSSLPSPFPFLCLLSCPLSCRKDTKGNEYLYITRDTFTSSEIIYKNIFETGEVHLLYCEDIYSRSYLFYLCRYEYGSSLSLFSILSLPLFILHCLLTFSTVSLCLLFLPLSQ